MLRPWNMFWQGHLIILITLCILNYFRSFAATGGDRQPAIAFRAQLNELAPQNWSWILFSKTRGSCRFQDRPLHGCSSNYWCMPQRAEDVNICFVEKCRTLLIAERKYPPQATCPSFGPTKWHFCLHLNFVRACVLSLCTFASVFEHLDNPKYQPSNPLVWPLHILASAWHEVRTCSFRHSFRWSDDVVSNPDRLRFNYLNLSQAWFVLRNWQVTLAGDRQIDLCSTWRRDKGFSISFLQRMVDHDGSSV